MIDRVRMGANNGVKLLILHVIVVDRATDKRPHGASAQNASHQDRTPHQGFYVFWIREKLRIDQGGTAYVGPRQPHSAAALGSQHTDVHAIAARQMPVAAMVVDESNAEVQLDIGSVKPRMGSEET